MNTTTKIVLAAAGGAGLALGVAYFGFWKPAHTRQINQIATLDTEVKGLSETKVKLETDLKTETEKGVKLAETNTAQETQLKEVRTRVGDLEKNVLDLSTQKATTEKEKADLSVRLDTTGKMLEAAKIELAELVKQNGALKGLVSDLETRLELAQGRVLSLTRDLEATTLALNTEKVARAKAETEARDQQLLKMAAQQSNAEMQQLYRQLTPTRLEQRNETLTGRRLAQKNGVPLGFIFDGLGDAVQGASEGIAGKKGPAYWVAVMPDKTEVRISDEIAQNWRAKGVPTGESVVTAEK